MNTKIKQEALDCLHYQNDSKLVFIKKGRLHFRAAKLNHYKTITQLLYNKTILLRTLVYIGLGSDFIDLGLCSNTPAET